MLHICCEQFAGHELNRLLHHQHCQEANVKRASYSPEAAKGKFAPMSCCGCSIAEATKGDFARVICCGCSINVAAKGDLLRLDAAAAPSINRATKEDVSN